MNKILRWSLNVIPFGIPLLIILLMVWLVQSPLFALQPESLSLGITVDLVLTVPLVYFLLIRNRKIPNATAIPFFVAGVIIASVILPEQQQFYLTEVKTWVLPVVETTVLVAVILKVRQVSQHYRIHRETNLDFYEALKEATAAMLPQPVAALLASEIAVLYYGFLDWKKRKSAPHAFSYHRSGTSVALLATILFLTLTETVIVHLLLARWSSTAAWILTGISFYTVLQLFGLLRSMSKRPLVLENGLLKLRYGILSEATIPLADISSVTHTTQPVKFAGQTRQLSPLGDLEFHNVLVHTRRTGTLHMMYGFKKSFTTLALYVDEPIRFTNTLHQALNNE